MSSSPDESPDPPSLLFPPNPSLSATKPPGSILLNRNDPSCLPPLKQRSSSREKPSAASVLRTIRNSFSVNDVDENSYPRARLPGPPAALYNNQRNQVNTRGRSSSVLSDTSTVSAVSSTSAAESPPFMNNGSYFNRSSSVNAPIQEYPMSLPRDDTVKEHITHYRAPSIHFAPLPERPLELKRRSSIQIGVAARANILKTQGSPAPKKKEGVVMMNDQEWEEYQARFRQQSGEDPPELHRLLASSTKRLWAKASRRLSSSNSNNSNSPSSTPAGSPYLSAKASKSPVIQEVQHLEEHGGEEEQADVARKPRSPMEKRLGLGGMNRRQYSGSPRLVQTNLPSIGSDSSDTPPETSSVDTSSIVEEDETESAADDFEEDDEALRKEEEERTRMEKEKMAHLSGGRIGVGDLDAERRHFLHEHQGSQYKYSTGLDLDTSVPHQGGEGWKDEHHSSLIHHFKGLGLHQPETEDGEGEETPRAGRSPRGSVSVVTS